MQEGGAWGSPCALPWRLYDDEVQAGFQGGQQPALEAGLITEEAKGHFFKVVEHEMFDMDRALDEAMAATTRRAAAVGGAGHSALTVLSLEEARHSLRTRAHYILGQLLRCLAAHNIVLDSATVLAASDLIRESITVQATSLAQKLSARPGYASGPGGQAAS